MATGDDDNPALTPRARKPRLQALVALPLPLEDSFHYDIPDPLRGQVRPGQRVRVPFGPRRLTGFVLEISEQGAEPERRLKPLEEILDPEPVVDDELSELAGWTADYYFASRGEVLSCAVPSAGAAARPAVLRLTEGPGRDPVVLEAAIGRSARRRRVVDQLQGSAAGVPAGELPRDRAAILRPLLDVGAVEWVKAAPRRSGEAEKGETIVLNASQRSAVGALGDALEAGKFATHLLLGVTGSGKTEVYLHAVDAALRLGRGALYLVPEIGLTPLLASRFAARYGSKVAVLHSGLGRSRRWEEWKRVQRGEATVVLGTRSAVFAPLHRPGLIVVDEEQETSFKQEERPRYNARDLALVRAKAAGAVVVLGSATPSLESFHRARLGNYGLLELQGRVEDRPLARVEVVDMREEFRERGRAHALSLGLAEGLREARSRGEQCVLLLNRRGYATFLLCRDCGELVSCPSCSVSLVHHRSEGRMRCHYCGHGRPVPRACEGCGSQRLREGAEGTERLEELLSEEVPEARIVRLDRDTVRRRGEAERILSGFDRGEWDILLGTQMVAKGHDFPNVTLVGVLAAEGTLGLPDFRAAERTFQLLTQVAGRSGRGDRPGRVIIQTFQPDHYAVRHARAQDYEAFYADELRFRRLLQYPPFTVLANLIVSRPDEDAAMAHGRSLAEAVQRRCGEFVRVLGPAPAPLSRLRGLHRIQILLKARSRGRLADGIRWALREGGAAGLPGRHVSVDMDPVSLL